MPSMNKSKESSKKNPNTQKRKKCNVFI